MTGRMNDNLEKKTNKKMAFTEKVSLSSTALSFLIYECNNAQHGQEGFLIGDVSSELTNHISDSQSDNTRLDIEIVIRNVLPLPAVCQFYHPTGRIKENVVSEFLSESAKEVVGWYKYRSKNSLKPTLRDKLISRGLQKYFEKNHERKNFVTCCITNKISATGSTHTFTYRFSKINCYDMYEYVEDVTANLGEKVSGYKKSHKRSPYGIFSKIIKSSNMEGHTGTDVTLLIHKAVDERICQESITAIKTEKAIKELEAEIQQMTSILRDRHDTNIQEISDSASQEAIESQQMELVKSCIDALEHPQNVNQTFEDIRKTSMGEGDRPSSPILKLSKPRRIESGPAKLETKPQFSYALALKKTSQPSTSSQVQNNVCEDLIDLHADGDKNNLIEKPVCVDVQYIGADSPEY